MSLPRLPQSFSKCVNVRPTARLVRDALGGAIFAVDYIVVIVETRALAVRLGVARAIARGIGNVHLRVCVFALVNRSYTGLSARRLSLNLPSLISSGSRLLKLTERRYWAGESAPTSPEVQLPRLAKPTSLAE
jgi:hypothetical protein